MFKVSTEELVRFFENRYEAVVVLAREARRVNLFAGEEISESGEKPILMAISKLKDSGIEFTYELKDEEESEEKKEKEKNKE